MSAHHECPMHDSDRRRRVQWLTCSYRRLLPSALSGDCGWQSKVQRSTAFVQSGLVRHNPGTCLASVVIRLISSIDSPFPFSSLLLGAYKIQIPSTLTMTPCPPALICIAPARNPFLATHTILWSALNYGRLQRGILSRLMQGLDTGSVSWSTS